MQFFAWSKGQQTQTSLKKAALSLSLALPIAFLSVQSVSAQSEDLYFTLKNKTRSTLIEFYLVPNDNGTWENDILRGTLLSGESTEMYVEDGLTTCTYDMYGVFSDGNDFEEYNLDLCELKSYTISD
ncbi:MAG: hypothetical protein AB4038_13110 [Prochloraceae cyanobacterium]